MQCKPVGKCHRSRGCCQVDLRGQIVFPSIQFDAASKRVSGADGCNRIMGGYNAGKDTITFGPIAATQMACLNNNGLERQYHAALEKVTHYQVFGKTLKLLDRHGNLLIQYESAVQPR